MKTPTTLMIKPRRPNPIVMDVSERLPMKRKLEVSKARTREVKQA